jgi:hypothetical protein
MQRDHEAMERQKRTSMLCGFDVSEMGGKLNERQTLTHLGLPAVVGECELRKGEFNIIVKSFKLSNVIHSG